jgi:basic amino acid/polyamine antiporter, APA family
MKQLKKGFGAIDIFSLAAGALISSGLFVLPGLVFELAGPSVILIYLLGSVLVLPAILSKAELATAMPKAGGAYFFVARSLGSASGLFSGLADWFSISLKSCFALVGMAAFIEIFLGYTLDIETGQGQTLLRFIASAGCVFFAVLNISGAKHASRLQVWLVVVLLTILTAFVIFGIPSVKVVRFTPFIKEGLSSVELISIVGMVFVSYGGFSKVAAVSEEIQNPGRNIPLGMLSAWLVVSLIYFSVVAVTVGVMEPEKLAGSLTPISSAAETFTGQVGRVLLAVAAMTAFITTANAGILASSRSLLAMSRDNMLPKFFSDISEKRAVPVKSIIFTMCFMIATILLLDVNLLVKTASTLMIILFMLVNAGVIVMRMSRIPSYRPAFKYSGYPYVQVTAIVVYIILIFSMGLVPLLISGIFLFVSAAWYFLYLSKKINQQSALMHVAQRITNKKLGLQNTELEDELREILLERDEIIEDRFDKLVRSCKVLDIPGCEYTQLFHRIAAEFADVPGTNDKDFFEKLCEREQQSSTVIDTGLAIPHIIIEGMEGFYVMMIRSVEGVNFPKSTEPVHCVFVLAGTKDERNYHLRALMAIAQIAQNKNFMKDWLSAADENTLRNLILLSQRTRHN